MLIVKLHLLHEAWLSITISVLLWVKLIHQARLMGGRPVSSYGLLGVHVVAVRRRNWVLMTSVARAGVGGRRPEARIMLVGVEWAA